MVIFSRGPLCPVTWDDFSLKPPLKHGRGRFSIHCLPWHFLQRLLHFRSIIRCPQRADIWWVSSIISILKLQQVGRSNSLNLSN